MIGDRQQLERWLEGAAAAVNLDIAAPHREPVVAQLELNLALIRPLLDFDIPATDASE